MSGECKCKIDGRKCISDQKWNKNKCRSEFKKHHICKKKDYIWDPVTCSCENGKYLASIIDDSVITCDEIIEETKTSPTNLNENKQSVKHKISTFYLHHFYQLPLYNLTVNIYCY